MHTLTDLSPGLGSYITFEEYPSHPAYYTRYGNPVHQRVAAILAGLEGTETALLTGSGMGAISTTVLALVKAGDHVVAQTRHYMSTAKLFDEVLPRFGVEATLVEKSRARADDVHQRQAERH